MAGRRRGECRSCGAPIEWAQTEKGGKKMPLDFDPKPGGNVVVIGHQAGDYGMTPVARYVKNGEGDRTSHFATCPDAKEHRRG